MNQATLKEIAAKSQYSVITVSRVMSGRNINHVSAQAQDKIRAIAAELGYRPNLLARGLKTGHSRLIGLFGFSLQHEVNAPLVVNLTRDLFQAGYRTHLIYDCYDTDARIQEYRSLLDQGCDALIIGANYSEELFGELRKFPIPVFLMSQYYHAAFPDRMIHYNYQVGCREAFAELEKLGHRQVLYLSGNWTNWREDERYGEFQKFFERHNPGQAAENFHQIIMDTENIRLDEVRNLLHLHPEVTAIFASNDLLAMQLIQILPQLGIRVPQDMSIIGFDDIRTAKYCAPALSTVHKSVEVAGQEMVKMVLNVLENQAASVQTDIPCHFISRQSVAGARIGQLKI